MQAGRAEYETSGWRSGKELFALKFESTRETRANVHGRMTLPIRMVSSNHIALSEKLRALAKGKLPGVAG